MYDLRILVNDKPIKKYHDEQGNIWVEARENTKYTIEVKNDSWQKILGIVSVDGLNVINAKHEKISDSNGYIIPAYGNIKIPGWKINQNEVREFIFSNIENSYSKKIGADENNIGVIAAAIISENKYISMYQTIYGPLYSETYFYDSNKILYDLNSSINTTTNNSTINYNVNDSTTRNVEKLEKKLSTGSGDVSYFKTKTVDFDRGEQVALIKIFYDSYDNLVKKGIIKNKQELPKPFKDDGNYCPNI